MKSDKIKSTIKHRHPEDEMSIEDFNREFWGLSSIDRESLSSKHTWLKTFIFIQRLKSIIRMMDKIDALKDAGKIQRAEIKFNRMKRNYFKLYNKILDPEERRKINLIRSN